MFTNFIIFQRRFWLVYPSWSTAISECENISLLLGLRHKHVITLTGVRVDLTCFWYIGASLGSISWSGCGGWYHLFIKLCSLKLSMIRTQYFLLHKLRRKKTFRSLKDKWTKERILWTWQVSTACMAAAGISYLLCSVAHCGGTYREWNRLWHSLMATIALVYLI